ncbi:hypothetical protein PLICRDRAFT_110437 [Plicaturopsis crispa FD-325 SS-3]|nr:hypothetical protein PLICRDRAFT_110437 [Plicaturopsis crispa FD-325 SS-3]
MSNFSPMASPAPRRTTRRTPRPPANSPPAAHARRTTARGPNSRLATPNRAGPYGSDAGMDVDEHTGGMGRGETLFAKSEEMTVAFYAHLPVEVKQVLKNADFYGDDYTGAIDTLTGFALVASSQTCFVWQHAQASHCALKGTPTCYIFACPRASSTYQTAPHHALVPYGAAGREPGLILISLEGEVRFWDSIGIGLAGGDHYVSSWLGLSTGDSETVTNLTRANPQTFVATTSTGRIFRLTLTSSGGKHHLATHIFARPAAGLSLSRLIPSLFAAAPLEPESGNINAVALGAEQAGAGREIWALVETRVQRWNMSDEGWEELGVDEELADLVRPALRAVFTNASKDDRTLDLELLDLAIDSGGVLIILVSYAGIEEEDGMDIGAAHPRRIYALVKVTCTFDTFAVADVVGVPYQSTSSSGAPMHPRIQLISGGELVSIQFGDAVALCARDSKYADRVELKSATDRTLGVGVAEEGALLVLTAATMMRVLVDTDKIKSFDPETGRANLIKSTMTQAILYGSYSEVREPIAHNNSNPLHFSFPPEVDEESLMRGAEQLSSAVLESDGEVVKPNHDLGAQLTGRKERLSWLIRFINDNAVLTKMSQSSRQRLATDAEKLYASHQLWLQYNDFLATSSAQGVLTEAIREHMMACGEGHHEDVVRAFFRLKVADIGHLLIRVGDVTRRAAEGHGWNATEVLSEANRIVLTVFKSALDYREYNLRVYGIALPMLRPWTSTAAVVDLILGLFNSATKLAETGGAARGPGEQLPDLAEIMFACIHERLAWLKSAAAADESTTEREYVELNERFGQLRPEVLDTLSEGGFGEQAFVLAERYRDFRSLASLCHKDTVFPPYENPNVARIQSYVDKFKEDFTTELYRWYIEHGELRTMFAQEDAYGEYMDKFFDQHPHPSISWIHDLGKGRHGAASETLLIQAQGAKDLASKHLMLSIGKLANLAQLHETEASVDQSVLDAFHDDLDFVSVHHVLLEELKAPLSSVRGKQSLDSQVDIIAKAKAKRLLQHKELLNVFKNLVRDLLQGKVLSIEDTADVLSLKDNTDNVDDYVTALHLIAREQYLPAARKLSAFRAVWRRIYSHDDWFQIRQTSGISDAELIDRFKNTALYAAILAVAPQRPQPDGYDQNPDQALLIPSAEEISSRWPGMAPEQVDLLALDYSAESDNVERLALDDVYDRVRELALQDVVWG